jgi:uncharacterized Zn-finger protein
LGCLGGRKVFTCPVCMRVLTTKYNLRVHYRCHTGERPYRCDVCKKTFIQPQHLKQHQRVCHHIL